MAFPPQPRQNPAARRCTAGGWSAGRHGTGDTAGAAGQSGNAPPARSRRALAAGMEPSPRTRATRALRRDSREIRLQSGAEFDGVRLQIEVAAGKESHRERSGGLFAPSVQMLAPDVRVVNTAVRPDCRVKRRVLGIDVIAVERG